VSTAAPAQRVHASAALERLFNRCFLDSEVTRLIGGASEPLYLPADRDCAENRLYYREDFFASALHEIAHWCIAGSERRRLRDFGYWYEPEGRGNDQQAAFLAVEARPQALEWYFSLACDYPFRLSLDTFDPHGYQEMQRSFATRVAAQAERLREQGLPPRAALFFGALADAFGTGLTPAALPRLTREQLL
jgi:elongation factor P hydroxylase